jgi:hypothetical protein
MNRSVKKVRLQKKNGPYIGRARRQVGEAEEDHDRELLLTNETSRASVNLGYQSVIRISATPISIPVSLLPQGLHQSHPKTVILLCMSLKK